MRTLLFLPILEDLMCANPSTQIASAQSPVVSKKRRKGQEKQLLTNLKYNLPVFKLMMVKENSKSDQSLIRSARDAAKLLSPLTYACEEYFVSLHLNAKHEVIGVHEVSHGTLSASLVHPREVFKAALVANSYAILVCHNHPSGARITASKEDLATTSTLIKAGKLLGVAVLDHIILGPHLQDFSCQGETFQPFSLREEHPELWQTNSDD